MKKRQVTMRVDIDLFNASLADGKKSGKRITTVIEDALRSWLQQPVPTGVERRNDDVLRRRRHGLLALLDRKRSTGASSQNGEREIYPRVPGARGLSKMRLVRPIGRKREK